MMKIPFIFKYIFLFIDEKSLIIDNSQESLFSDCLRGANKIDFFLFCNTESAYQIDESEEKVFSTQNYDLIKNERHKSIINNFVEKMNKPEFGYGNQINQIFYKKNNTKRYKNQLKISFYIKIIDLKISESVYWKSYEFINTSRPNLTFNEEEIAMIIDSHIFSMVNNSLEFVKKIFFNFCLDNFDMIIFERKLLKNKDYYLKFKKIIDQKTKKFISKDDKFQSISKSMNNSSLQKKNKKISIMSDSIRNYFNFIFIFFQNFRIQVFDLEKKPLFLVERKCETKSFLSISIVNFFKIVNFIPDNFIFIPILRNLKMFNQIIHSSEFDKFEKIILNISDLISQISDIRENHIEHCSKLINSFFEASIRRKSTILQFNDLRLKHSSRGYFEIYDQESHYTSPLGFQSINNLFLFYYWEELMHKCTYFNEFIKYCIKFSSKDPNINCSLDLSRKIRSEPAVYVNFQIFTSKEKELLKNKVNNTIIKNLEFKNNRYFEIIDSNDDLSIPYTINIFGHFKGLTIEVERYADIICNGRNTFMRINSQKMEMTEENIKNELLKFQSIDSYKKLKNYEFIILKKKFTLSLENIIYVHAKNTYSTFEFNHAFRKYYIKITNCTIYFLTGLEINFKSIFLAYCSIISICQSIKIITNKDSLDQEISLIHIQNCQFVQNPSLEFKTKTLLIADTALKFNLKIGEIHSVYIHRHDGLLYLNNRIFMKLYKIESSFTFNVKYDEYTHSKYDEFLFEELDFVKDYFIEEPKNLFIKLKKCKFSNCTKLIIKVDLNNTINIPDDFFTYDNGYNDHSFDVKIKNGFVSYISCCKINE